MYGIQIAVNGTPRNLKGDILYRNVECRNYMINKFSDDKIFWESDNLIILLDGVILNKKDLISQEGKGNWIKTIETLYSKDGVTFFKSLRGSFAGALYDKSCEKLIVFTDQLGSKFIYFSQVGEKLYVSQVMGGMYELLKEQNIPYHMDPTAAKILLTYGFMIEDYTLCKEIKKIEPGCYLTYQNGKVEVNRYYMLDNTPDETITEEKAIEEVDRLFRQAVKREYEKDVEYGYKHVCALSGGLDCRMTTFVAHDLGYTRQLNTTFSQTDYLDQTIPQQMAADLKHEWLFKALDNGMWLYDVDEVTRTTGGNVLYYGTAHGNSMLKYLNFGKLGLMHSGQIGDVTIGTHTKDANTPYKLGAGAYSTKYLKSLSLTPKMTNLNQELGLYYYRYLNGTNNGIQNIYNFTETISPFMDLDFLEYALRIPTRIRYNHHLYKKWILLKYPQAAKYVWESTGCKIDARMIDIFGREKPLSKLPEIIMSRLGIKKSRTNSKNHMNPVGYYLANNRELFQHLSTYFKYVDIIEDKKIKDISTEIIKSGAPMEKIQLITFLATIKLYYDR